MLNNVNRRNFIAQRSSTVLAISMVAGTRKAALANPDRAVLSVTAAPDASPLFYTDQMLLDLPQTTFTTETIWTVGPQHFSGPSLSSLLRDTGTQLGKRGLRFIALNNYSVICPKNLIESQVPIIANRRNGKQFGVREKGPLWVVFPYDSDERFRTETTYAMSVWQLAEIHAL